MLGRGGIGILCAVVLDNLDEENNEGQSDRVQRIQQLMEPYAAERAVSGACERETVLLTGFRWALFPS